MPASGDRTHDIPQHTERSSAWWAIPMPKGCKGVSHERTLCSAQGAAEAHLCWHRAEEDAKEVCESQRHELVEGSDLVAILEHCKD